MKTNRMEAFSDGVLAIVITIMVLELKAPHGPELSVLTPLVPGFVSYVLSFVYIGIYWNNHHYILHTVRSVSGGILWANLHLLFWLSLFPVSTAWMGENHFAAVPTALYGAVLLVAGLPARARRRQRFQGQGFAPPLPGRHPGGLPVALDLGVHLRPRGPHVADPGSPHRACTRHMSVQSPPLPPR